MDRKQLLELVRKVKKLADRGVGGEAAAAKIKLRKLYEKYNFTDDDFVELQESYNRYFILRHNQDKLLLSNLICMILETPTFNCGESNNVLRVKLTDDQYNDILQAFEYYQKIFDDYSNYLMHAIVSRNAIGFIPKPSKYSEESQKTEEPNMPSMENSDSESEKNESINSEESTNKSKDKPSNSEFDMIKLMKLAVAIESNPWKKIHDNKNLPEST